MEIIRNMVIYAQNMFYRKNTIVFPHDKERSKMLYVRRELTTLEPIPFNNGYENVKMPLGDILMSLDDPELGIISVNHQEPKPLKLWASSTDTKMYPATAGLASAIKLAYSYHRTLVLRPDDLWTCITQGAGRHILKYAERYRYMFVNHAGKKMIIVSDLKDNWATGVEHIVNEMSKVTKNDIVSTFTADFSTTDSASLTASYIVLMTAMKQYFDYEIMCLCGIPAVEMEGTREDWKRLIDKTVVLEGLLATNDTIAAQWFSNIRIILTKLLDTYDGNVDTDWWSHIMDAERPFGSGGGITYNGWFRQLFFYNDHGELLPPAHKRIDWSDLPVGAAFVPFIYNENGAKHDLRLIAGHAGIEVRDDGAVIPIIGWAITDNPPAKETNQSSKNCVSATSDSRFAASDARVVRE